MSIAKEDEIPYYRRVWQYPVMIFCGCFRHPIICTNWALSSLWFDIKQCINTSKRNHQTNVNLGSAGIEADGEYGPIFSIGHYVTLARSLTRKYSLNLKHGSD